MTQSAVRCLFVALTIATGFAPQSRAQSTGISSPWVTSPQSRVRLIGGAVAGATGPGVSLAGVEIAMTPKWKTYWRMPGDSGVPPNFDWSGSENLADARVLYPAPTRIKDKSGVAIAYVSGVVLPIEVRAKDPALPVKLSMTLEYGVCLDICIPVEAKLVLDLPPAASAPPAPAALGAALALVPRVPEKRRPSDPAITSISNTDGALRVIVTAADAAKPVDVFVETPDGTYIASPDGVAPKNGTAEFRIPVAAADFAGLVGKPLVLTLVNGAGASETTWIAK